MSDTAIHVACCFDRNMAVPACVLAQSIAAHPSIERTTVFHAFHTEDMDLDVRSVFERLKNPRFDFSLTKIDNRFFDAPTPLGTREISVAAYARAMLCELLGDCSRVIYLDADTLVMKPLEELYDTDLSGACVGAMVDALHYLGRGIRLTYDDIEIEAEEYIEKFSNKNLTDKPYFNSGVLIIDLEKWKALNLYENIYSYNKKFPRRFFADQDALNYIIGDDFVRIDPRWNAFALFCDNSTEEISASSEWQAIKTMWQTNPWIIHFAGECKPWKALQKRTMFDGAFWNAHLLTPFGEGVLQNIARRHRSDIHSPLKQKAD